MNDNDDLPKRPAPLVAKPVLDRMDVDDLHAYIAALKGEIMRAEVAITNKQGHRQAAEAFFKIPE